MIPRIAEAIRHAFDLDLKGENEAAVQHLSTLAAEFPTVGAVHGCLALVLYHSGNFREAIRHGRQAVFLSPLAEKSSFVLFAALWKAGQHIDALDEMKRLLTLKPSKTHSEMIQMWDLEEEAEDSQATPLNTVSAVRDRLAQLEINEDDVSDAVDWARKTQ